MRKTWFLTSGFCAAVLALLAPDAPAATYTVWTCRGPAGEPLSAGAWQSVGSGVVERVDSCAADGALVARVPAGRSAGPDERGGFLLRAPAGAPIVGYRVWRSARAAVTKHPLTRWYAALLEDGRWAEDCADLRGCYERGDPSEPLSPRNLVTRSGVRVGAVGLEVGCGAKHHFFRCPDSGGTNAELRLFRGAFDIEDARPPALAGAASGPPPQVTGVTTITVPARDTGAGLRSAEARIDGRPVAAARAPGCREPYTRPAPCPATTSFRLALDTRALADGPHRLEVAVSDGAGNVATLVARDVQVANGVAARPPGGESAAPPPDGDDAPPPDGDDAVVRLARRRFAAGRGAIAGRVLRRDGRPLAGATLLVERRWYGVRGGGWRRIGRRVADAGGGFRLRVPAKAQQLRFRLLPARRVSRTIDIVTTPRLRARMAPRTLYNGEVVAASGRLLLRAGPATLGKPVEIQAIVHGRWQTVGRASADARGRFRWRYRFHNTFREALYSFRIRVPAGSRRWPWPAIASRRIRLHVLP